MPIEILPHPHHPRWFLVLVKTATGYRANAFYPPAPTQEEAEHLWTHHAWIFRPYDRVTGRFKRPA